jgi:DNA polymerase elongation subunit (family B)
MFLGMEKVDFVLIIFDSAATGFDLFDDEILNEQRPNGNIQASDFIVDIREYDVPYHVRVSIDKGLCSCFVHVCLWID